MDFTVEPLKNAGIFAITGSTGSGKSTLLDALCLALFDSTPRMTKAREAKVELADVRNKTIAQSDSRSVLRRGTAEGYAEVDFIATNADEKKYIQVTESMMSEDVRKRELAPLQAVQDNYEKIVIAMDCDLISDVDGIKIVKALDFLLSEV